MVYIGSCSGSFFAFDLESGEERWRYDTEQDGASAQFHGDPLLTDELVVVGSDARPEAFLYAFDRPSGAARWKIPFPGGVTAQIVRYGETALVVAVSGETLAVELGSGVPLWIAEPPPADQSGAIGNDPALAGELFVVPWRTGQVEARDAATGELVWRTEVGAVLNTSAVAVGDEVVVGALDGRLHRLDLRTGSPVGALDLEGAAPYGDLVPAGDGHLVALWARGGVRDGMRYEGPHVVARIDPAEDRPVWQVESAREWSTMRPWVGDASILVGRSEELLELSIEGGDRVGGLKLPGLPRGLRGAGARVVVGQLDGKVLVFRHAGCE